MAYHNSSKRNLPSESQDCEPSSSTGIFEHSRQPSYFVPGYCISKHVMYSQVHAFLGPNATLRPYTFRGRDGYLITSPGRPLTRVSTAPPSHMYTRKAREDIRLMQPRLEPDRRPASCITPVRTCSGSANDPSSTRLVHKPTGRSSQDEEMKGMLTYDIHGLFYKSRSSVTSELDLVTVRPNMASSFSSMY
jgi:hypothetical protein